MLKRLRFLYRYFFSPRRRRQWMNLQSLMVVGISATFLGSLYMTAPISQTEKASRPFQAQATQTVLPGYPYPAPVVETAAPADQRRTPLPEEYLNNANQSIGITLASVVLVMIVVVGALMFIPQREE
jgi:hypothetical protein